MIEIEHDPRCWLAQAQAGEDSPEICTCEQIAQLEEQARSVLEEVEPAPSFLGMPPSWTGRPLYGTSIAYSTMTAAYPMGSFARHAPAWAMGSMDPADLSHHIDHMAGARSDDPGKAKVDRLAAHRAAIYAEADAQTKWDLNPLRWLKGKGFGRE